MAFRQKRKRPIYKYIRKRISVKKITPAITGIIVNQIVKNNLSPHQKKIHNYNGKFDLTTLTKVIHSNHSQEVHDSIMNNHIDISYVNLYYGNKRVRIESNGSIMAIVLYCRNIPRGVSHPRGWKSIVGNNKIVLYTEGDSLISGDVSLFHYNTSLRVYRAEVIGAEETLHYANINIEGVDYWEYLKGNWETMDSVHWNNYKETF
ncbi:hypothetical protein CMI37_13030 [Candidatus Pacearchaeota archaeon]|nr:hypothetical protein [Candidatus Pacearchaeota archaeon]|tara:strand:- start:2051 stop:2665 length:615 start_codon:yes stop_codon:yes gene_type:complete